MKIIINNYTIKFKDSFINETSDKQIFGYLFTFKQMPLTKILLMRINKEEITDFISYCLEFPIVKKTKIDFEIEIMILFDKYKQSNNITKYIIIGMIGSMILFNIKYKNFKYLNNLESYFQLDPNIKYLIIMINNLEELIITHNNNNNNITNNKFNILDFIFDYNCN